MIIFLKIFPPFSSYWIKKCIKKEFNKIAKPNVRISDINTFVAERSLEGWDVYVKIRYPKSWDKYLVSGWTCGNVFVCDTGKVNFQGIIEYDKVFYAKSIIDEASSILREKNR